MDTRAAALGAALAFAALAPAAAQAQAAPTRELCEGMAALDVAWQNFEALDLTFPLSRVDQAVQQVSAALDQVAEPARNANPAAYDRLKQAHVGVEVTLDAVPDEATPAQVESRIASAKDNERAAYQTLADSIVCP